MASEYAQYHILLFNIGHLLAHRAMHRMIVEDLGMDPAPDIDGLVEDVAVRVEAFNAVRSAVSELPGECLPSIDLAALEPSAEMLARLKAGFARLGPVELWMQAEDIVQGELAEREKAARAEKLSMPVVEMEFEIAPHN